MRNVLYCCKTCSLHPSFHCCPTAAGLQKKNRVRCGVSHCSHVLAALFLSPVLVSLNKSHWCLCQEEVHWWTRTYMIVKLLLWIKSNIHNHWIRNCLIRWGHTKYACFDLLVEFGSFYALKFLLLKMKCFNELFIFISIQATWKQTLGKLCQNTWVESISFVPWGEVLWWWQLLTFLYWYM